MKGKEHKKKKPLILCCLAAVLCVIAGWIIGTNHHITTTYVPISSSKIPRDFSGFKIAIIADLHNHPWGDKLIALLEKESPEIIAITGDLVDSAHTDFEEAMQFVADAKKIAPVYYVTGNHEARIKELRQWEERLKDAGVHKMDDAKEWIRKGNAKINLAGVEDPDFTEPENWGGIQESMVETKLASLLEPGYYNVVLCHRPELFNGYVRAQADLVLTGHAHGRQIRLPFIGGLFAPHQGFFPKYTEGIHHQGETDMVINRGLGNSVLPVRINNTPELVVVTLEPQ